MHLNNIGKQIKKINISNNKITIKFIDQSRIMTSFDMIKKYHLKEGMFVKKKILDEIINSNLIDKYKTYLLKICAKHLYNEKEIEYKLFNKGLNKSQINELIKFLKDNKLINDESYIESYFRVYSNKNYSIKKIRNNLISKGFSIDEISNLKSTYKEEYIKAQNLLDKRLKAYEKFSYSFKKRKIYVYLTSEQFDNELINDVISKNIIYSHELEIRNLRREYSIAYYKYHYKYLGELCNKKVIQYLLKKGYSIENIRIIEKEY